MDLYNILSINGIDIDEYLNKGGGSSEDINEIKNNVININNILTYNMTSFKNNIRYFDSDYTAILNNYLINNCSDVYVKNEIEGNSTFQLLFNSTIIYDDIINYINAFKLNSDVEMCVFNNCKLPFFELYMIYTNLSETINLDFEYKTLIISNNNYYAIDCFSYLINSTYILDDVKIYHSSTLIDTYTNAWYHFEHIIKNCNALSFSITANLYNSGNITYNPAFKNLKINECSVVIYFNDNFDCDYVFSDCNFKTLYLLYSQSSHDRQSSQKLHINMMFENCIIGDLYLLNNETIITIDNFINSTSNITKNIYICGQESNIKKYTENYKIPSDLVNKINTFTTYNAYNII